MGNTESFPKRTKKQSCAIRTRRSSSGPDFVRSLEEKDLDNIIEFVRQMKQTSIGEHMLEDFIARQSEELESDEHRQASSIETFPIRSIQIEEQSQETTVRPRNQKATPSAWKM